MYKYIYDNANRYTIYKVSKNIMCFLKISNSYTTDRMFIMYFYKHMSRPRNI